MTWARPSRSASPSTSSPARGIAPTGGSYGEREGPHQPHRTKKLIVPARKAPDGEGSETWDRWQMRVHKRLIDLDADDRALRQLMRIQVPDGVNIEIMLRS